MAREVEIFDKEPYGIGTRETFQRSDGHFLLSARSEATSVLSHK